MTISTNNYKIGLFALGGLGILITGILLFGVRSYFEATTLYETYFDGDVEGLEVGSSVRLRGVLVGKVKRISFSWSEYQESQPSYIVVQFYIRDDAAPMLPGSERSEKIKSAIDRGFRARLTGQGITGSCFLSLEYLNPDENPPAVVPWIPRHSYIPSAPGKFGEMLASVDKSLHNINKIDFNNINVMLQGNLKMISQVLDKVNQIDFVTISTNANLLLADSRRTIGLLQPELESINFNVINKTLDNAQRALRDIDDVLIEIKKYPSGFILGSPPLPIREVIPSEKK
jgi:phospholipid/cholesterol/gamma-HCH transport system substrate-binding protein